MTDLRPRDFALGIDGFSYADLYEPEGLARLVARFDDELASRDPDAAKALSVYRAGATLAEPEVSDVLIRAGAHVGPFVARLFGVEAQWRALAERTVGEGVLFDFKRDYVARRVRKRFKAGEPVVADEAAYRALEARLAPDEADEELRAAKTAMALHRFHMLFERPSDAKPGELAAAEAEVARLAGASAGDPKAELAKLLDVVDRWHAARIDHVHWLSYHQPRAIDAKHTELVQLLRRKPGIHEAIDGPDERRRMREGFKLTDARMSHLEALGEVHYCLYCHDREKDSCRTGLYEKSGSVKKNPLGIPLEGCPLDERISEAHWLRKGGDAIAALAVICVDNPMAAGTGHRICNDCMKSCIYQKQEPVNIPQAETNILTDVLRLPYGFEIYSLLTRWNPLNRDVPAAKPYNGRDVLVVGLGPAGYTLAHHLVNQGFGVVGIDGLKLEPLPSDLVGADEWPPRALESYSEIEDALDERILQGFGGVAEYGITVRWDKNFLKVIYLGLARRRTFRAYGGIRFGGTLTIEDVWQYGFDHIAIATGAGRPTIVEMKNNLITGIRKASDFLMGLQLTGAAKETSLANLQVELPALVIGGGLTAIDTATELAAYYPVQVEKVLRRVEVLGEEAVFARATPEEKALLDKFITHAKELREERKKPRPNVQALVAKWGGVSIAYRRSLFESPAYRLNHEEVEKALEEGIVFIENLAPVEAIADQNGHVSALRFTRADKSELVLPARSVMVAAGTTPNTIYEKERPGTFELDEQRKFFKAFKLEAGGDAPVLAPAGKGGDGFFTSYRGPGGRLVSFYGDNHPKYAGNVVKAMASAKHGHKEVVRLFAGATPSTKGRPDFDQLLAKLDDELLVTVHQVNRLTPTIVEVIVKAKMQARKFEPGQFYRFQNFESLVPTVGGTRLLMEGLALTGAWVDKDKGLLSMIALEVGVSSRLVSMLRVGEPVVVMGPTGTPTEIPENENVVLCGGGLGNAVLFSVAKALRARGNKVVYFAGYRKKGDMFKREEVETSSDQVIWAVDAGEAITPDRPQDRSFVGNIVQAMQAYASGALGDVALDLKKVDRIIAIGSDRMMAAVAKARHTVLADVLKPEHEGIGSINSPMQCMMKEVCAQCLQRHVDPATGAERFVFSCFNQDQKLDEMDWTNLNQRLKQNSLLEKIADLWLAHLVATHELPRV
ncbi:FAD-dependent oxidoreductase [Myxococcota bacterium]|nr:FAD-dependent oxidoreductase [Myxococcota bacterium]